MSVEIDVSIIGPLAEKLDAEVIPFPHSQAGREGDGYIAFARLSLNVTGEDAVTLPLESFAPSTAVSSLGGPDDWFIDESSGLGVSQGGLSPTEVAAAQDQSLVGTEICRRRCHLSPPR